MSEAEAAAATPRGFNRLAPVAVGLSLLAIVALLVWYQTQRGLNIMEALRQLDARVIPVAIGLHVTMHLLWALRVRILAGGLGVPIGYKQAWVLVTSGQFGGAVTPGRVGAEAAKLAILIRRGVPATRASRVVLADRASDVLFFLVLGTLGAILLTRLFGPEAATLRLVAFLAAAALLVFAVLLVAGLAAPRHIGHAGHSVVAFFRRLFRRHHIPMQGTIQEFLEEVRSGLMELVQERPWRMVAAAALSLFLWASEFSVLWVILQAMGHDVAYHAVFAAGVLITMLAAVPVSPGGAGVAEFAAMAMLAPLAPGLSPVFVLVWRALTYYYDVLVGGAVASVALPKRSPRT